ncbi:protein Niban 1-like [Clinocottus analis]|uniref:protein Niban 1-like n=1 Tax=Clinocottus analis TaxID=304258 RepID=UPI0035BF86C9
MGASSSGLLDEAKTTHIKGVVNSTFQSFSVFYRQQYSAAYIWHLHQEVEPQKEGRGLLLTQEPQHAPEEVLYQGSVKFSSWDEQGKKCRERYAVLRRDYRVEIHENFEAFSRGCAANLVLQPARGSVFTTEEESRDHLEQTCAGILNGGKKDSFSMVPSPDLLAVYLHLPYMGHTCFLFQREEERDNFLSALKICIRHCNLDPWCDSSYESQAYIRALRLYRQDNGCYESWEMLLGTEEQVLAFQVMGEMLSWLQSQIQARVKGKRTERIRQWLATVQATYMLVLEQLTASLEALRVECRQKASANQALIRSNLDQIISSHCFLEEKVKACVREEAEKVCSESVAPYMSSILEALTENISVGIQGMKHTLLTQMDFTHTDGRTEEAEKALSPLRSISLDPCYRQVENLTEKLGDLKQRFGLSSTQRLVQSAHLEMEKLSNSAVYTSRLFSQASARLQPAQIPVKVERAKERVLKQLDYDSRVVQRQFYQEALLEITLPVFTREMDSNWISELKQFEQYIFSDYCSFILVHNIYDDVLRKILCQEIETVVHEAASKTSNSLSLDTSDLTFSRYSLLEETPPRSASGSPAITTRDCSSLMAPPGEGKGPALVGDQNGCRTVSLKSDKDLHPNVESKHNIAQSCDQSAVLPSPFITVTQELNGSATEEASCLEETQEGVQLGTDAPLAKESTTADPSDEATTGLVTNQVADVPAECAQSDQSATPQNSATPVLSTSEGLPEDTRVQHPCPSMSQPPGTHSPTKISLGSLREAIGCNSAAAFLTQTMPQHPTDRAVYLTGEMKENWEVERVKEEDQTGEAGEEMVHKRIKDGKEETGPGTQGDIGEVAHSGGEPVHEERATALTTEQREREDKVDDEERERELVTNKGKEDKDEEAEEKADHDKKEGKKEVLQNPRPMEPHSESSAELPLGSVAIIRELVVEVTEVETVVGPCPDSSHAP